MVVPKPDVHNSECIYMESSYIYILAGAEVVVIIW